MWDVTGKPVDPATFAPLMPAEVLYDFDGPRTFTFIGRDDELYLAHWCDEDADATRFLVVPTSARIVDRLKIGKRSLRAALNQPRAWLVDERRDGGLTAWRVHFEDLPNDALPRPGTPLWPTGKTTRRQLLETLRTLRDAIVNIRRAGRSKRGRTARP